MCVYAQRERERHRQLTCSLLQVIHCHGDSAVTYIHTHTPHDSATPLTLVRCADDAVVVVHDTAHTVEVEGVLQPLRVTEVEALLVSFLVANPGQFPHRLSCYFPPVAPPRVARDHKVGTQALPRLFPNIHPQSRPGFLNLVALYICPL